MIGQQLAVTRERGEFGDRFLETRDRQRIRLAHHRHDQPSRSADGDAEMHAAMKNDVVAIDRRVDDWQLA